MKISNITRQLSFEDIKPKKKIRYMQILDRLSTGNKTAKEIAVELFELGFTNTSERNTTAPRLTELEKMEYVEETAKKTCQYTGKAVTVYKITQKGYEAVNYNHIPRIDQEESMDKINVDLYGGKSIFGEERHLQKLKLLIAISIKYVVFINKENVLAQEDGKQIANLETNVEKQDIQVELKNIMSSKINGVVMRAITNQKSQKI